MEPLSPTNFNELKHLSIYFQKAIQPLRSLFWHTQIAKNILQMYTDLIFEIA